MTQRIPDGVLLLQRKEKSVGGRGASSASRYDGGGGLSESDILSRSDLISLRGLKQTEVDDLLTVLRDVNDRYGSILEDVQIATLAPRAQNAIAFYGSDYIGRLIYGYYE